MGRLVRGRLVRGIGFNDLPNSPAYKQFPDGTVWKCPYYTIWSGLLTRCTSVDKYDSVSPCYIGASVCKEWLTRSVFESWMKKQDWEGKALDKDIITPGNMEYGPDNCRFVHRDTNSILAKNGRKRIRDYDLPRGITRYDHAGMHFQAAVGKCGKEHFKRERFIELEDAVAFYNEHKATLIRSCLEWESDPEIRKGINREADTLHPL